MSSSTFNPERIIPGLAEQRAQERENRALAFAGITHTVCGREIVPLTPGHRLNLQLVGNAFAFPAAASATLVDVFVFLWVLSPHNTGTLEAARQQVFLREDVMKMDRKESVRDILRYIVDQLQDTAESSGEAGKDNSAWIHWMAMDAEFWISVHGGFTLDTYKKTPYLVLQQLYRAWRVNHPDIERNKDGSVFVRDPVFFNQSDKLVSAFQREHREKIKAWHLAQKTRRN